MAKVDRKTHLTDTELAEFRQLLLDRRERILAAYQELLSDVQDKNRPDGGGAQSNMPTHPADLALDDELNEATTQMAQHERDLLVEIDEALRRIDRRTYGVCVATGQPISRERLRAIPWTRYSIDYAQHIRPVER